MGGSRRKSTSFPRQSKAGGQPARHPPALSPATVNPKIGKVLLDLRDALRKAERCRRALAGYGVSRRRWQEIVRDIDPNLRFMARPQLLDAVITYLESLTEPVEIDNLVTDLHERGAGTAERIRQVIRMNLGAGRLERHPENRIALARRRSQSLARGKT